MKKFTLKLTALFQLAVCAVIFTLSILHNDALATEAEDKPVLYMRFPALEKAQSYSVTVFNDGRVLYEGFYNVRTTGKVNYTISRSDLDELIEILRRSDLFNSEVQGHIAQLAKDSKFYVRLIIIEANIDGKNIETGWGSIHGLFDISRSQELVKWQAFLAPLLMAIENKLETRKLRCPLWGEQAGQTVDFCKKLKY